MNKTLLWFSLLCVVACDSGSEPVVGADATGSSDTGADSKTVDTSVKKDAAPVRDVRRDVLPAIDASGDSRVADAEADVRQPSGPYNALLFTRTEGFRHGSIADAIEAYERLALANDFTVQSTEQASDFNDANLANFDVVVFLETTGDVLDDDEQAAFERYIQSGKGYVGVHSATDTEYDWNWYGGLVGAYFDGHPRIQEAVVNVEDSTHASTAHLAATWSRRDEWYNYRMNPRSNVHVLLTLDESTYDGGTMGDDHPIAWCHNYDGGRSWYTGGGHTSESYSEPEFEAHLLGGITWAARGAAADCD